jgi:DNA polymerase-3 subunit gamma/tau
MSYLVLARKYRPQAFEEVVGQDHVTQTLRNAIRADRVAHAILFAGPRGVGKTSVARILAKAMNCKQGPTPTPCNVCKCCEEVTNGIAVDVLEIDGASNRGIDEVRELRENIKYMPGHNRFKIYIIDEVHMLTAPAFNALLKTLEEPPAHVLFIFATTEPNKIPITILSRCQRHDFRLIGLEDIVLYLKRICQEKSFDISEESLCLLAGEAGGSMRDALSLLDQVMVYSEGGITDEEVLESLGAVSPKLIFDLSSALLTRNAVKALDVVHELYNRGYDLKRLYVQMVEHFRHLLVVKMGKGARTLIDVPAHEMALMKAQAENASMETLNQIFQTLFEAEASVRLSAQSKLALEAIFVKIAQFVPVVPFDEILNKLDSLAKQFDRRGSVFEPTVVEEGPQGDLPLASEHKGTPVGGQRPVEDLGEIWQQLVSILDQRHRSLGPDFKKAHLTKVDKDFLEITVRGNSFNTARLRDQQSVAAIESACSQFFNRKMKIKIVEDRKHASQTGQQGNSDRNRCLKKDALSHPIVTDTLEVFDGRVTEVKIL